MPVLQITRVCPAVEPAHRARAECAVRRRATPAPAAADSSSRANGGGFPLPAADLVDVVRGLRLERPFVFAHSVLATLALHAEALSPGLWASAYLYEPVASVTPAQVRRPAAQPGSDVSAGSAPSAAVVGAGVRAAAVRCRCKALQLPQLGATDSAAPGQPVDRRWWALRLWPQNTAARLLASNRRCRLTPSARCQP